MNTKRNFLKLILVFFASVLIFNVQAQENKKTQDCVILTSAECVQCKKRLEDVLNYTAGIRYAILDVPTQQLSVRYVPKKISLDEIRLLISKTGYDADEVHADKTAQESLPLCCQPGGMNKHKHD